MAHVNTASKKRRRNELEDENETNIHPTEPSQKKIKLDPIEIILEFMRVRKTANIKTINLIIDLIKYGAISTTLMNSYWNVKDNYLHFHQYETLLQHVIDIIYYKNNTKRNQEILLSLKNLLCLMLENGANPMLEQNKLIWFGRSLNKDYEINTSLPRSTKVFRNAPCKLLNDIKFDFYLFSNTNDLKVSILNISHTQWGWINTENDSGFYFSDHIATNMITTEFTFDIGIKALCWYNLITFYEETVTTYNYQQVIKNIIHEKSKMILIINTNMRNYNDIKTPIWMLHLFILKEYYKVYPMEFVKCFDQIPMDIVNILKDYCIPKKDYSFLDQIDSDDEKEEEEEGEDDEEEYKMEIDEHHWILRCLENIHLLGQDWRTIFYQIMMKNRKYSPYLLDFSIKNWYKDIYSSIYELIWNDMQIIEKISNNPHKLMHFVARTMQFGHKELLSKFLKIIDKTYEFDYKSFIGSVRDNEFDWSEILNFCIIEYKYDQIRHSMFVEICEYIKRYCDNDSNVIFNVLDKLWTKREWINDTKWTKNKLQCLKILKRKMDFDLNKSLKHCYLRQNGKYKITSIKLVTYILKYERKTLLNYQLCKQRDYLRNIRQILNYSDPISNKMIKIVEQLTVSFKQWESELNDNKQTH